jgi:hypothetical protein
VFVPETQHRIVGVAHNDDATIRFLFTLTMRPEIENIVKVNIRELWEHRVNLSRQTPPHIGVDFWL